MGNMAQKIVKVNISNLIETLNQAYSEEWLAYYQYWIGAKLTVGQFKTDIEKEFLEHAKEEFEHADMIANRILQLGGIPVINFEELHKIARCKYEAPINENSYNLVIQNLESERCAIGRYQGICEMCFGKDHETYRISEHILMQELAHEQEMEDFIKDMDTVRALSIQQN